MLAARLIHIRSGTCAGHYYAMTRFGCALDCNDPHFNGVDGILGLGLPDAALHSIPTPLIFALATDRGGLEGANYINERPLHQRKFAFLSTGTSAELQLGGYDRARCSAGRRRGRRRGRQ